jgi:hypothetical protein
MERGTLFEKAHHAINNCEIDIESGKNNLQVESSHSPLVRLCPTDLSTPQTQTQQQRFPQRKQICLQSWKRWKIQVM